MQITENDQAHLHPLLQKCTFSFTATVLGAACLTIWGFMFPMTLVASAQTLPKVDARSRPPIEMRMSSSTTALSPIKALKPTKVTLEKMAAEKKTMQPMEKSIKSLNDMFKGLQKQLDALQQKGIIVPSGVSDNVKQAAAAMKAAADALQAPAEQNMVTSSTPPPVENAPIAPENAPADPPTL